VASGLPLHRGIRALRFRTGSLLRSAAFANSVVADFALGVPAFHLRIDIGRCDCNRIVVVQLDLERAELLREIPQRRCFNLPEAIFGRVGRGQQTQMP